MRRWLQFFTGVHLDCSDLHPSDMPIPKYLWIRSPCSPNPRDIKKGKLSKVCQKSWDGRAIFGAPEESENHWVSLGKWLGRFGVHEEDIASDQISGVISIVRRGLYD